MLATHENVAIDERNWQNTRRLCAFLQQNAKHDDLTKEKHARVCRKSPESQADDGGLLPLLFYAPTNIAASSSCVLSPPSPPSESHNRHILRGLES
jgi:hypothetical protein